LAALGATASPFCILILVFPVPIGIDHRPSDCRRNKLHTGITHRKYNPKVKAAALIVPALVQSWSPISSRPSLRLPLTFFASPKIQNPTGMDEEAECMQDGIPDVDVSCRTHKDEVVLMHLYLRPPIEMVKVATTATFVVTMTSICLYILYRSL
jgi:hypothetical protein